MAQLRQLYSQKKKNIPPVEACKRVAQAPLASHARIDQHVLLLLVFRTLSLVILSNIVPSIPVFSQGCILVRVRIYSVPGTYHYNTSHVLISTRYFVLISKVTLMVPGGIL